MKEITIDNKDIISAIDCYIGILREAEILTTRLKLIKNKIVYSIVQEYDLDHIPAHIDFSTKKIVIL